MPKIYMLNDITLDILNETKALDSQQSFQQFDCILRLIASAYFIEEIQEFEIILDGVQTHPDFKDALKSACRQRKQQLLPNKVKQKNSDSKLQISNLSFQETGNSRWSRLFLQIPFLSLKDRPSCQQIFQPSSKQNLSKKKKSMKFQLEEQQQEAGPFFQFAQCQQQFHIGSQKKEEQTIDNKMKKWKEN